MARQGFDGKTVSQRKWVSLVPYGLNQQHPNAYKDIAATIWENRDNLGYAWRILNDGCCDGCSLGTSGMHDWTMKGIHLCAVRLKLLRLNTMPAMDWHLLEDVDPLRNLPGHSLRRLGRLAVPMVRRRGDKGFRRINWDEAITLAAAGLMDTDPHRLVSDFARPYKRSVLRPPESGALFWHQPRGYQRANLPRPQHGGLERNRRLRRHHLLILGLDRHRPARAGRNKHCQQSARRDEVPLLCEAERHEGFRRQPLLRTRAREVLGPLGHKKRIVRHEDCG